MFVTNYGTWESPLTSEVLARGNVRYGSLEFDAAGTLYTTELRSFEQGRTAIVRIARDGSREDVLPAPFSARSRVHEYGGRSVLVERDRLYFTSQADQQLYRMPFGGQPEALTHAPSTRFAEPIADPKRPRLICVAERHTDAREPENFLAQIDLATGAVEPLVSGRTFYAAPALSPDGTRLAFLAWDHPHMPWDAAELWVASLSAAGLVTQLEHIAGDHTASALQPTYSPDGTLYFALEADGYLNLHRLGPSGVERVTALRSELGAPLWSLGATHWAFADARTVVGIHFDRGRARLSQIDVGTGEVTFIADSLPYLGQLAVHGREVVAATGWSGSGAALVRVSLDDGKLATLANAHAGLLDDADVSSPEPIEFPTTHGETAYGFFYAPRNQRFTAPSGTLPPLIVVVHGGPTASTSTALSPTVQFFTTRGFALLDVNYRGSSGYGREYRDRLRGQWGVIDVDDCLAGARYLAEQGRVDGARLLIRGGSAGGYTVLQAMQGDSVFAAGACHYGISDLEALTRDTHKFESHYDRFLIGPYPERRDLFVERSPIHHVDRIARPVVFFQGLDDKVVPADQTERMADALRARGVLAEYHGYEGEQHGFRKAETIRHVLEAELAFFRKVLALGG
jgi:dipeptidyl aminopeptidase/acylaminoacyl peptidase